MKVLKSGAHTRYDLRYHFIWVSKIPQTNTQGWDSTKDRKNDRVCSTD